MKRRSIFIFITLLAIIILAIVLVKNRPDRLDGSHDGRLSVATSFYPLYFFAVQIGGERANVVNITPAGGEPHDYEPTPQDIMRIVNSNVLVLNGGGLEPWSDNVRQIVNPEKTKVVIAGEDFIKQTVDSEGNMIIDPHVWLAPLLAQKMVEKIDVAFEQADPANAAYYKLNANALLAKLEELDTAYQQGLAQCTNRDMVTAHASFGYLAASYGLRQVPIAGLSPDTEPSPRQMGTIVQLARSNNTKYIFFESLASPKLSETIAREIGAKTLVLNPIEGLTPGEISQGRDYISEMMTNLVNLEIACK